MKKTMILLLALCLLCGCGRKNSAATATPAQTIIQEELVDANDSVSANGLRYEGSCSAKKENGAFQGKGEFRSNEGWIYTGEFAAGVFAAGEVQNLPYTLSFGGLNIPGSYSGEVYELLPQGKGSFTATAGGTLSGSFASGKGDKAEAEALPCSLYLGGSSVEGCFTGSIVDGEADGQGVFECSGGRTLRYEGGFEGGEPAGKGKLTDSGFICHNQGSDDRGCFEGSTLNGYADGEGSFQGRNSENVDYSYEGSWAKGLFDGQGKLIYDSELYYDRIGGFSEGSFAPSGIELLECLGTAGPRFTLTEKTKEFLKKFPEVLTRETLLPKAEECDYRSYYNLYQTYAAYKAMPETYEGSWMYFFNDKILERRTITAFGDDYPVGYYVASNLLYNDIVVCYLLGSLSSFESANVFNCYAVPLGMTTITNANGDEVEAIAILIGGITTY